MEGQINAEILIFSEVTFDPTSPPTNTNLMLVVTLYLLYLRYFIVVWYGYYDIFVSF